METLKKLPFKTRKAVFEKLEKIVDIASLSKEEREKYDESIKVYRDTLATMEYAEVNGLAKGLAEGLEKGLAEGERKKQMEVARNLKQMGLSVEIIVQGTGLAVEEIENL